MMPSLISSPSLHRRLVPALLLGLGVLGCEANKEGTEPQRVTGVTERGAPMLEPQALQACMSAMERVAGKPVMLLRLEVYPLKLVAQFQERLNPEKIQQFECTPGRAVETRPTELLSEGPMDANLFHLEEIAWARLPQLAEKAELHVDAQHGSFERAVVRRALPQSPEVRMRVYVGSPGFDGYLDADAHGDPL